MDLNEVAVFVEAVRAGSLASAARRLVVAPMVASRRLASLETALGTRLVHRTTRALSLTPEGEAFLPYAQAMLENEAEALGAIRPAGAGASGLLRVTASLPFGRKVVTPMVPGFLAANPSVRIDLMLTDSIVDIVAQGLDLAIRIAPMRDSGLIARKLADSPRALYAAPAYIARAGVPRTLADLAKHECLRATDVAHWRFLVDGKPVRQRVSGRFTSSSFEALHRACLEGLGIVSLASWDAHDEVAAGRMIPLPLSDAQIAPLAIWAVQPTTRFVPGKVRAFIAALETHLLTR
ncbi:LysR family transcriptional regulator [Sphingomonas sanxanigenens]|uniref:HTH lysR-type domain-containing protein n=1 Tax=Sphingomonas sanxanigenens DSM 19645 = NX02 TaxID=1123269 RepID=W0A745_9SPHN|nr:LysR family transcriptional regulator [Sphingomonas sanxanigenens]AHE53759.1 hypothetical protein NX02_10210 [Sphingomonas sanxanigenens DSM 19645 = NX02]